MVTGTYFTFLPLQQLVVREFTGGGSKDLEIHAWRNGDVAHHPEEKLPGVKNDLLLSPDAVSCSQNIFKQKSGESVDGSKCLTAVQKR